MTSGRMRMRLVCPQCTAEERIDAAELSARLRALGMLKRDDQRDPDFLVQLARSPGGQMACTSCGASPVTVELAPELDQWDAPAKPCAACGAAIPAERVALYPESELCAACQQRIDRGQSPDQHDDYCPRCGARMIVRQRRGSGVAGYELRCPECRR